MAGTKHGDGSGGDTPGSFGEFFWRLLNDQGRLSNLIKLAAFAVVLICVVLLCLGGILFMLARVGAKGPGLPVLLPSGLIGVPITALVLVLKKLVNERRRDAIDGDSDPTSRSLPSSRKQGQRGQKRRR
jgi:hypothetical protein